MVSSRPGADSPQTMAAVLARVGVHAAGRGHRNQAPMIARRFARRRVDNVVEPTAPPVPGPHDCAGTGQTAVPNGHDRSCADGTRRVDGDGDGPAAERARTGHGHVPAHAHQRTRSGRRSDAPGSAVGGEGLGRGAQVEVDSGWESDRPVSVVVLDIPPPGCARRRCVERRPDRWHVGEVSVVSEFLDSKSDGGVHGTLGALGHFQGHDDGLVEKRTHLDRSALRVQAPNLGIGPEPATGSVDGLQLLAQDGLGLRQGAVVIDGQGHRGPQGMQLGHSAGRVEAARSRCVTRHHPVPPDTAVGACRVGVGAVTGGLRDRPSAVDAEAAVADVLPTAGVALDELAVEGGRPGIS